MAVHSNTSLIHALHRASQVAEDRLVRELGDINITPRQLGVLATIDTHDGLSQTDIVDATGIDRSTMADIVLRLIKRGLVSRKRTKHDARAYAVKLTADGSRVLAAAMPVLARVEAGLLKALPAKKQAELVVLLEDLTGKGARVEA